jgi:RHS repeat-associated protein
VIKHIDARGKRDSTAYDGNGNVLVTVSAHNDTTRFWYRSDGLLDSLRAQGTSRRRFAYDSVWKNRAEARQAPDDPDDPDELLLFTRQFDALGRDSVTDGKLKVSIKPIGPCAGGVPCWQWRLTEVFYNAAGQVDSMQQRHTGLCADPCTTPPAPWSSPEKRVGVRFDRAGRDSVRTGETGVRTLYLYDRLGRILVRRPWTDSAAVRDSFVYDVAGNVKKTITRRGDEITTNYDSRNRDTLTVIPSVGTVRRAFGGPLDQLTRLWYDSPVDSIGGVNAELRWGYDQRGRLKADTSYTGTTARVTTHTYDRYERDSLMADPLGTWATRYETDRGIPDTLLTPMGDTVTYTFDTRGRPVGPAVHGGTGPMQTRSPGWTAVGGLFGLSTTVALSPSYRPLDYHSTSFSEGDDEAATPLGPVWYEQRGADAGVDTLRDSVSTNPYGWVTSWTARRNGSLVASESYGHTGSGDLTSAGGDTYTYNSTTGRLTSLATGAGTWSYTYDRAGNLIQAVLGANTWAYGYDALNRLRSVRYNGTLIARYAYDVLGRRIAKRVYSSATGGTVAYTRFVYHGSQVALETDSTGTIGLRYTWGLEVDDLIGVCTAPCTTEANHYYVTVDQLRNVREVTRRDGTWLLSRRFGPYGAQIEEAGAVSFELRYRWTGREYDAETGFYFFRARYYDVAARRFVQEDPVGYSGGASLYQYGEGNPLSGRDPDGLKMNNDVYWSQRNEQAAFAYAGPENFFWSTNIGGAGPRFDDWTGWNEYLDERWNLDHQRGESYIVTVCTGGSCSSVMVWVANGDFDADKGHELDLMIAGAVAAIDAGATSFTVSSFTSGHAGFRSAHNRGDAMDISAINGVAVASSSLLGDYLSGLMSNTTLPIGSQVMAPGGFGYSKAGGASWIPIDMNQQDPRSNSPYYGQTLGYMHRHHIHVTWGWGFGVPEY